MNVELLQIYIKRSRSIYKVSTYILIIGIVLEIVGVVGTYLCCIENTLNKYGYALITYFTVGVVFILLALLLYSGADKYLAIAKNNEVVA